MIHVASALAAPKAFERLRPDRVVSISDPGEPVPTFPGLDPSRHLVLRFHDIDAPEPGYVVPTRSDVLALIEAGRFLRDGDAFLVHCAAGVSRSPAAAAVILCAGAGPGAAARFLAEEGPFLPNAAVLGLGDVLLGTGLALVEAGRRAEASSASRNGPIF